MSGPVSREQIENMHAYWCRSARKDLQGPCALGIVRDAASNAKNPSTISSAESQVRARIIPAEEEAQIARHVYRLMGAA
jgi:acetate kinase